ncbi:carbohydrate binding family 9 domain-containing protein [Flagellimonas marinaquae]|uniref:carbohydrate binding family 9 domain-containing protein n=1 Tax=Flagellimonas marinaquae TaxID=254955 RepID=UPI0020763C43|nr:DUF5916 domain-containing protein [Allomuricauda aquimarina]USD23818.1 carbohydrate binding family 9 domain-containing protein [Allomuricauda aquimarina]
MKFRLTFLLTSLVILPFFGQENRPRIVSGYTSDEIKIDGILNESLWEKNPSINDFLTVVPIEGGRPSQFTEVKIVANEKFVVFGIECKDDPLKITNFSKLRDADFRNEDYVRLVIDPFQDGQSGYIFMVNPNGARYDALVSNRGESESKDWDGIWEAGTNINADGWTAEIKIPIQSINFRKGLGAWGFNFERNIQRNQEIIRWANVSRDQWFTQTSRAGLMVGLPDFNYGVGLNITPSVIGNWTKDNESNRKFKFDPSVTASQRLSSNALITATFNTDFAETEVDSRQTNLTRFPLFFPEKRAFFLEGSDIFEFGFGLSRDIIPFFSRRIGLVEGNPVPIVAGGKINGRTGRTSFGGLVMHTNEVDISVDDNNIVTIPKSTMGVVRAKHNIFKESSVGFIASVGDPLGRSDALTGGLDFTYQTTRLMGNKNFLVGVWGLYNERQDLSGDKFAYGFKIDYPNDIWDAAITYAHIGDAFDPSVGFVPRNGINKIVAGVTWAPRPKWKLVRQIRNELFGTYITDLNGQWQSYRVFTAPLNWRFESGERFEFNVVPTGEFLTAPFEITNDVTIPTGSYEFIRYRFEGDIASKRNLNGRMSWWFGPFYKGRLNEYQLSLSWSPSTILTFEMTGTRNVAQLPYGDFDQTLAGFRIRFNATPDLQVNSFIQYDTESDSLGINSRIHWIFHPQGEFFLVFNNASVYSDINNRFSQESSQIIAKIRYTFRL